MVSYDYSYDYRYGNSYDCSYYYNYALDCHCGCNRYYYPVLVTVVLTRMNEKKHTAISLP